MFEKEAEEIANKRCHEIMCYGHCFFSSPKHHRCGEWHREYNCAKEGIEYGYNKAKIEVEESYRESLCNSELNLASVTERLEELEKANEWHYVKDGDFPKDKGNYLVAWKRTHHIEEYGKWGFDVDLFNVDEGYFEGVGDYVIAWKEIVLPKEIE